MKKKIEPINQDIFKLALDPDLIVVLENMEDKFNELVEAVNYLLEREKE